MPHSAHHIFAQLHALCLAHGDELFQRRSKHFGKIVPDLVLVLLGALDGENVAVSRDARHGNIVGEAELSAKLVQRLDVALGKRFVEDHLRRRFIDSENGDIHINLASRHTLLDIIPDLILNEGISSRSPYRKIKIFVVDRPYFHGNVPSVKRSLRVAVARHASYHTLRPFVLIMVLFYR